MEGSASTLVFMSLAGGFLSVAGELEQWSVAGLWVLELFKISFASVVSQINPFVLLLLMLLQPSTWF